MMIRKALNVIFVLVGFSSPALAIPSGYGTITGHLAYGGEHIPENLTVCARDTTNETRTYCTTRHIKGPKGKVRCLIPVPQGSYYVYAYEPDCLGWRMYYTDAVACGLHVKCPSHRWIAVIVRAGANALALPHDDWSPPDKKNACDVDFQR